MHLPIALDESPTTTAVYKALTNQLQLRYEMVVTADDATQCYDVAIVPEFTIHPLSPDPVFLGLQLRRIEFEKLFEAIGIPHSSGWEPRGSLQVHTWYTTANGYEVHELAAFSAAVAEALGEDDPQERVKPSMPDRVFQDVTAQERLNWVEVGYDLYHTIRDEFHVHTDRTIHFESIVAALVKWTLNAENDRQYCFRDRKRFQAYNLGLLLGQEGRRDPVSEKLTLLPLSERGEMAPRDNL